MKMPWVILILIFPIMGVGLYLLIGLNGGTHKMRERYAEIDSKLLPMLPGQSGVFEQNKRNNSEYQDMLTHFMCATIQTNQQIQAYTHNWENYN